MRSGYIHTHRGLLADRLRTDGFRQAILDTVHPGDVVLDLGCGTGVLALFACQAGAERVYAVEEGDVIELARLVCRQNGFEDRVVFLNGRSQQVDLPERVDVIVTETLGNFGVGEGILAAVADARRRALKPDGVVVPAVLELIVAPVEDEGLYRACDVWSTDVYGVDLSPVRPFAMNVPYRCELICEQLLGEPATLARFALGQVERGRVRDRATCAIGRDGILHGIGGWFVAELAPGCFLTNHPPLATSNWQHAFFPLERPVVVTAGDEVAVAVHVSEDDVHYHWQVEVGRGGADGGLRVPVASFDQGACKGFPLSDEWLRRFLAE